MGSEQPCVLREEEPASGSVCGDGHCTGSETKIECPQDCFAALPDQDGDGLPDVRDLCPLLDARSPGVAVDPETGNHVDADGDRVGDECTPSGLAEVCAPDPDRDFAPDAEGWDNCPGVHNPQQRDGDGDGIGDECDPCPTLDRDAGHDHRDPDGDGIGNACDNCPEAPNPSQANCNLEAELAAGVAPLGDACDPTPCGETRLATSERTRLEGGRRIVEMARDIIKVDARAQVGEGESTIEARAGKRFCVCSIADRDDPDVRIRPGNNCQLLQDDQTGLCEVADLEAYMEPVETADRWRPIRVDYEVERTRHVRDDDPLRTEAVADYTPTPDGLFEESYRGRWRLGDDQERWARLFPEDPAFGPGPRGVLWTHTPGGPAEDEFFPPDERELTNHYWSGRAEHREIEAPPPLPCRLPLVPWVPQEPLCPVCDGAFPTAWLSLPAETLSPGRLLCSGFLELPPVLHFGNIQLDAGELFASGLDSVLREHADDRWLAASEPEGWLPQDSPVYAAVASDGTAVHQALQATDQGLLPLEQRDEPPILFSVGVPSTRPSPPGRADHLAVLSARRSTVWVGGGADEVGQPLRDLWAFDLQRERWRPLPLSGARPERVLAATYSPVADALWVLDRVEADVPGKKDAHVDGREPATPHGRVRLLRIDARGGGGIVADSWPRRSRNSRYALGVDPAGALYVAASGEHRGPHVVLRLEPHGDEVEATGFHVGGEPLAVDNLRAGPEGVSLIVRRPRARFEPVAIPRDALRPAGPGAVRRCF